MKIKSNKTFDCYDTAYESWSGGKDITLDGIKLIPITILDTIRAEIEQVENEIIIDDKDLDEGKRIAFMYIHQIIDKYKAGSEE